MHIVTSSRLSNRKVKLMIVVSEIDKALAFEWFHEFLDPSKFLVHFILIGKNRTAFAQYLMDNGGAFSEVRYETKKDILRAFGSVFRLIRKVRPDVVHTHLFVANLVGLTAAWLNGVPKRVYTRHHAMLHHREHPSGQKYDKWCNRIANYVVAPSQNIRNILTNIEGVAPSRIHLIHHGFDYTYFREVSAQRIRQLRDKYDLPEGDGPVIGVIARFTEWKGIQYVIPAFRALLSTHPQARLVLANAKGDYAREIEHQLQDLQNEHYRIITFESDLAALYRLFDVYVHVPVDAESEAFGQTYVEAQLCGCKCIYTVSGVLPEISDHLTNSLIVPHRDSDAIHTGIERLLKAPWSEVKQEAMPDWFTVHSMIASHESLYLSPI